MHGWMLASTTVAGPGLTIGSMTLLRRLVARPTLLLRRMKVAYSGPWATSWTRRAARPTGRTGRPHDRATAFDRSTRPIWLKFWQSAGQASDIPCVMAMQVSVEMYVARRAGVALTIQQLRAASVYTVTYDEHSDRHLHEVFAPFGIPYQPAEPTS